MPDHRLYALSGTYTDSALYGEMGPSLLINDPAFAMRWYLDREREHVLAVALQVSDDGGASWRPMPPHALWAETIQALSTARQASDPATRRVANALFERLAFTAAEWLDEHIHPVEPADPKPRPDTPILSSWEQGGQMWALVLGSTPPDEVLNLLIAKYPNPHPGGPARLRATVRQTLASLSLAETPASAPVPELLQALQHLESQSSGDEIGRARAHTARDNLVDHLATRLLGTAATTNADPDLHDPAHQVGLAQLARALEARTGTLYQTATATEEADITNPRDGLPPAIPGFPRTFGDLEAAAAWRVMSPAARRDADQAMADLVRADTRVAQTRAHAANWVNGRPPDPGEAQAIDERDRCANRLDELHAHHAALMHGGLLAAAEVAARIARHHAAAAAAQATLALPAQSQASGSSVNEHDAFIAQIGTADARIHDVLEGQRQLCVNALHRCLPEAAEPRGMNQLRSQVLEHAGLGFDAQSKAARRVSEASQTVIDLEEALQEAGSSVDHARVTIGQVDEAGTSLRSAEQAFAERLADQQDTRAALAALEGVATRPPSDQGGVAARVARFVAQIGRRAQEAATAARPGGANSTADQADHAHHEQTRQPAFRPWLP